MSDETPILRVQVGIDPNNANANPLQADYQHITLRSAAGHNGHASETAGRPVYDRVLILKHVYPGSADLLDVEIKRYPEDGPPVVVDPERAKRFAVIIAKFELDGAATQAGTPLAAINLDPAQIANLGGIGITTVEALADVPDSSLNRLGMGARSSRDRALAFRTAAEGNAPLAALQTVNDGLVSDIAELRRTMAEQMAEQAAFRAEVIAVRAETKASRKAASEASGAELPR